MTPTEEKVEKYKRLIGENRVFEFEERINFAVDDLMKNLEDWFVEDHEKSDFLIHVFAKTMDRVQDEMEFLNLLN